VALTGVIMLEWETSPLGERERRWEVFARITNFEGSPERLDELRYAVVERILPAVRRLAGFAGALVLADRHTGNVRVVVLWDSEEAMGASEDSAYWFRTYGAETSGERISGVERYEVIFSEVGEGAQLQ
jgi:heme-degrading monooxygenase HmoA